MSPNGHAHNNNSAANAAELLLCVWPFWDTGYERVKFSGKCNEDQFQQWEQIPNTPPYSSYCFDNGHSNTASPAVTRRLINVELTSFRRRDV